MLSHCFSTALVSLYHRFNTALAASDFQGARLDNQDGRLESLRARHETIMYLKRLFDSPNGFRFCFLMVSPEARDSQHVSDEDKTPHQTHLRSVHDCELPMD